MTWYFEKDELRRTASAQDDVPFETENRYRREGARFIINAGTHMDLGYNTMATGVVYFHRFYMYHSFRNFPRYLTACSCLFLAGKVEETPKKCKDIINIAKKLLPKDKFETLGADPEEEVMTHERFLLLGIKFDMHVDHPYKFLIKYAKCLIGNKIKLTEVVQMAWTFVNDSLCTTLCLQWEPEVIAIALMHLAIKLSKFDVLGWEGFTPNHSFWWDKYVEGMNVALLEDVCHQILDIYTYSDESAPLSPPALDKFVIPKKIKPPQTVYQKLLEKIAAENLSSPEKMMQDDVIKNVKPPASSIKPLPMPQKIKSLSPNSASSPKTETEPKPKFVPPLPTSPKLLLPAIPPLSPPPLIPLQLLEHIQKESPPLPINSSVNNKQSLPEVLSFPPLPLVQPGALSISGGNICQWPFLPPLILSSIQPPFFPSYPPVQDPAQSFSKLMSIKPPNLTKSISEQKQPRKTMVSMGVYCESNILLPPDDRLPSPKTVDEFERFAIQRSYEKSGQICYEPIAPPPKTASEFERFANQRSYEERRQMYDKSIAPPPKTDSEIGRFAIQRSYEESSQIYNEPIAFNRDGTFDRGKRYQHYEDRNRNYIDSSQHYVDGGGRRNYNNGFDSQHYPDTVHYQCRSNRPNVQNFNNQNIESFPGRPQYRNRRRRRHPYHRK